MHGGILSSPCSPSPLRAEDVVRCFSWFLRVTAPWQDLGQDTSRVWPPGDVPILGDQAGKGGRWDAEVPVSARARD